MQQILGQNVLGLKENMARKQKGGKQPDMDVVLKHIQDHYKEITLAIDIMHVKQIPFLITTSRHIHYYMASILPLMNGNVIVSALQALYKFYFKHEFQIVKILVDDQFDSC